MNDIEALEKSIQGLDGAIQSRAKLNQQYKHIIGKVLVELGNIPHVPNNKHPISEFFGVQVKKQSPYPHPNVSVIEEWTLIFEENLCVSLLVENNNAEFSGRNGCLKSQTETSFVPFPSTVVANWISPKSTKQFLVCTNKEILQTTKNEEAKCILHVDWMFTAAREKESKLDQRFLAKFKPNKPIEYAPANFTFEIIYPGSKKVFTASSLCKESEPLSIGIEDFTSIGNKDFTKENENLIEDIKKIVQCLFACREHIILKDRQVELNIILKNNNDFAVLDYGEWQFVVAKENSLWNGCIIYLASKAISNMPDNCIAFSRNRRELQNLEQFLKDEIFYENEVIVY